MTTEFRQAEEGVDRRALVITWTVLLPLLVVLAVVASALFGAARRKHAAQGVEELPVPGGEVSNVHTDLFRRPAAGELLKERQRKTLDRYGWVDRQHGIVRVPIDVAMAVVAKERP
jgi:hypothetical protein